MSALRGFAQPQVYGGAVEVGEERGQLGGGYRGDRLPVIDPVDFVRYMSSSWEDDMQK